MTIPPAYVKNLGKLPPDLRSPAGASSVQKPSLETIYHYLPQDGRRRGLAGLTCHPAFQQTTARGEDMGYLGLDTPFGALKVSARFRILVRVLICVLYTPSSAQVDSYPRGEAPTPPMQRYLDAHALADINWRILCMAMVFCSVPPLRSSDAPSLRSQRHPFCLLQLSSQPEFSNVNAPILIVHRT